MDDRRPQAVIGLDAARGRSDESPVQLIFPPLVSSGIGHYYPSTAVLAAYLDQVGVETSQINLNQEFAEHLFRGDTLQMLGSGKLARAPVDSLTAAVARWIQRRHELFVDADSGKLLSYTYEMGTAIPKAVGEPFLIDPGVSVLLGLDEMDERVLFYRDFFRKSDIVQRVRGASLIGISIPMGPQIVPALLLADMLKEVIGDSRIVLGGPSMSLLSDEDLAVLLSHHHAVDCVVRYDGEFPLAALATQAVAGRWDPQSVAGVSCRVNSEIRHRAPQAGPDVRRLPQPKYSAIVMARLARPYLSITQARGCYWGKCDYCDFVELYDGSPPFRGRHPEEFVRELEQLVSEHGVTDFIFITESIPPAFARRMSKLLIERQVKVSWVSFAMVDRRFDRDLLALMSQAGCDHLVIGLETTVTRLLKLVHKSADRAENLRFLRDARAADMKLRVNLIPDLPTATYEEAMQCLNDIREVEECIDGIAVFPFEPTRSSNVGRFPTQFGLEPSALAGGTGIAIYSLNHMDSIDPAMTPEQRTEVHRLFQELEDSTVRRKRSKLRGALASVAATDVAAVRVPVEDFDIWVGADRIVCHDMRTLERVNLSEDAARVLRAHMDGAPFESSTMRNEATNSVNGGTISGELIRLALLVPADGEL